MRWLRRLGLANYQLGPFACLPLYPEETNGGSVKGNRSTPLTLADVGGATLPQLNGLIRRAEADLTATLEHLEVAPSWPLLAVAEFHERCWRSLIRLRDMEYR